MVRRQRRVTKDEDPHYAPAVVLQPGWVIRHDAVRQTVVSRARIGNGPKYLIETDYDSFELGAADQVAIISTESTSSRA